MKVKDFEKAVQKTPVWVPVFRVTRVPTWADEYDLEVGELLHYDHLKESFARKQGTLIHLSASCVEFEGYKQNN